MDLSGSGSMWDRRFREPGWAYGTAPNDFLVEVAARIPPGEVLCLAEGEGRNATYLAGLGYRVTAVDSSAVGLDKARLLARERSVAVETVVADLADFEIERSRWSGIVSIFCHVPAQLRADVHARCVDALAGGGVFVLEAYTPRQLDHGTGGPRSVELLYEPNDIRADLSGLDLEIMREIVRDISEGRYHRGPGAVVQALGVKPFRRPGLGS